MPVIPRRRHFCRRRAPTCRASTDRPPPASRGVQGMCVPANGQQAFQQCINTISTKYHEAADVPATQPVLGLPDLRDDAVRRRCPPRSPACACSGHVTGSAEPDKELTQMI